MANNNPQNPSQKPGQDDQAQRQGNKAPGKPGQEWSDDESSNKPDSSRD